MHNRNKKPSQNICRENSLKETSENIFLEDKVIKEMNVIKYSQTSGKYVAMAWSGLSWL
jgi:hypothetical protein